MNYCETCPIHNQYPIVPPEGDSNARVVIVGEGPGSEEVQMKRPFVGASGRVLKEFLGKIIPEFENISFRDWLNLRKHYVYITNACLCAVKKPPKSIKEICKQRLHAELDALSPKLIIAVGDLALEALLGFSGITNFQGFVLPSKWGPVLPIFHMAYMLRVPELFPVYDMNARKAKEVIDGTYSEHRVKVVEVQNLSILEYLVRKIESLSEDEFLSIDLETSGTNPFKDSILCVSLSFEDDMAFVVPFSEHIRPQLSRIFTSKCQKTGHNFADFDYRFLRRHGFTIKNIGFDTLIAQHLLNENTPKSLDFCLGTYSDFPKYDVPLLKYKNIDNFGDIPKSELYPYAGYDAAAALYLTKEFMKLLTPKLLSFMKSLVLPAQIALSDISLHGILIDDKLVDGYTVLVTKEVKELQTRFFDLCGKEFNLNSTTQLSKVLFEDLKLPILVKTEKGKPSTSYDVLTKLAEKYEAAKLLKGIRKRTKLISTYLKGPKGGISRYIESDGRVHPVFNISSTKTGRLVATDPPVQTIPKSGLRNIFVAPKGYKLISCDLSQAELRVAAWLSKCSRMLELFNDPKIDVHNEIAAMLFKIKPSEVTPTQRRLSKFVSFGILYGRGPASIADSFNMPYPEACKLIDDFFSLFPELKFFNDRVVEVAEAKRRLVNVYGRVRRFGVGVPFMSAWKRQAINYLPQSIIADHVQEILLHLHNFLNDNCVDAHIVLQIHDELVVECVDKLVDKVKKIMEVVTTIPIVAPKEMQLEPLVIPCKIKVGQSWGKEGEPILNDEEELNEILEG